MEDLPYLVGRGPARDGHITSPSQDVGRRDRVCRAGVAARAAREPIPGAVLLRREPAARAGQARPGRVHDVQLNTVELGLVRKPPLEETLQPTAKSPVCRASKAPAKKVESFDMEPRDLLVRKEVVEGLSDRAPQSRPRSRRTALSLKDTEIAPPHP